MAARPRRETEECYAVMLPNFPPRNLFVNCILHTSCDRTLLGPHSTVRREEWLYGKSPDHFPFVEWGLARETTSFLGVRAADCAGEKRAS